MIDIRHSLILQDPPRPAAEEKRLQISSSIARSLPGALNSIAPTAGRMFETRALLASIEY